MMRQMRRLGALLGVAALLGAPQPAAASEPVMVIAASAAKHMGARMKGGRKAAIQRDALRAALDAAPDRLRLGLLSYGETPKRKCDDVSDLTPIAAAGGAKAAMTNAARRLKGGGRAAHIAAILRADELASAEPGAGPRSVVLIAGGADDCAEDPCAAAKAFAARRPGVAVHVLTLAPPPPERARLRCIADNTGGRYAEALDAADATRELTRFIAVDAPPAPVVAAPSAETPAAPPGSPAPSASEPLFPPPPLPERGAAARVAAAPAPNVSFSATLAEGAPPLRQGVAWRAYALKPGAKPGGYAGDKPVWSGAGPEPKAALAPGRYHIEATYGFASAGRDVTVEAGAPLEAAVTLNAGSIAARAVAKTGGEPLDQMFYILYAAGLGGREIGRSSRADAVFHVPAGSYRLVGQHGQAEAETLVAVAAGETARAELAMNAGVLKLEARAKSDGPTMAEVFYYVFGPDDDGKEIARSAAPQPEFRLAGGRYRVVAQYDLARAEKTVTVQPGRETSALLILDGAGLRLSAKLAGRDEPLARDVQFTLYKLDNGAVEATEEIGRYASLGKEIYLRSGRYRVESKYGYQNAVEAAEITIAPGETRQLTLLHRAGEVKLALVNRRGGPPLARARWTVTDAAGAVVLSTTQSLPQLTLKSGAYTAAAQYGGKTVSASFEVADNDAKTVEVELK
ncbi:MAG: hypothetical protein NW215_05575 [Hyphomicrobiales bacterium]|nr:hypothetical protein [Hyphomicrobiales bacterium]